MAQPTDLNNPVPNESLREDVQASMMSAPKIKMNSPKEPIAQRQPAMASAAPVLGALGAALAPQTVDVSSEMAPKAPKNPVPQNAPVEIEGQEDLDLLLANPNKIQGQEELDQLLGAPEPGEDKQVSFDLPGAPAVSMSEIRPDLEPVKDLKLRFKAGLESDPFKAIQVYQKALGYQNVRFDETGRIVWSPDPGEAPWRPVDKEAFGYFDDNMKLASMVQELGGDLADIGGDALQTVVTAALDLGVFATATASAPGTALIGAGVGAAAGGYGLYQATGEVKKTGLGVGGGAVVGALAAPATILTTGLLASGAIGQSFREDLSRAINQEVDREIRSEDQAYAENVLFSALLNPVGAAASLHVPAAVKGTFAYLEKTLKALDAETNVIGKTAKATIAVKDYAKEVATFAREQLLGAAESITGSRTMKGGKKLVGNLFEAIDQRRSEVAGSLFDLAGQLTKHAPVDVSPAIQVGREVLERQPGIKFDEFGFARLEPYSESLASRFAQSASMEGFDPKAAKQAALGAFPDDFTESFAFGEATVKNVKDLIADYNVIVASQQSRGGLSLPELRRLYEKFASKAKYDKTNPLSAELLSFYKGANGVLSGIRDSFLERTFRENGMEDLAKQVSPHFSKLSSSKVALEVFNKRIAGMNNKLEWAPSLINKSGPSEIKDLKFALSGEQGAFESIRGVWLWDLIDRNTTESGFFNGTKAIQEISDPKRLEVMDEIFSKEELGELRRLFKLSEGDLAQALTNDQKRSYLARIFATKIAGHGMAQQGLLVNIVTRLFKMNPNVGPYMTEMGLDMAKLSKTAEGKSLALKWLDTVEKVGHFTNKNLLPLDSRKPGGYLLYSTYTGPLREKLKSEINDPLTVDSVKKHLLDAGSSEEFQFTQDPWDEIQEPITFEVEE